MRSIRLNANKRLKVNDKTYRIKSLDDIKKQISETKSKLDVEISKPRFQTFWPNFDPFRFERIVVANIGNTCNVSNAWLKCYELLNHFKLLPESVDGEFMHFDNAAFPGAFIISTHHLVNTTKSWSSRYNWTASSLISANDQTVSPLEDKYQLYKEYPHHWLMNENNNGDVLLEKNQIDFHNRLGNKVNLYTSDLGFDVSGDFNSQELQHLPTNLGQILSGLLTLRVGGNFITKQYTFFEPSTVAIMYLVASFFEECHICKPQTSRSVNSETYLVGIGFKGGANLDHPYIKAIINRINTSSSDVPIFDAKDYSKDYLRACITFARELAEEQIKKIDLDIERSLKCLASVYQGDPSMEPIILDFRKQSEPLIQDWYILNPVLPIEESFRITKCDALSQL